MIGAAMSDLGNYLLTEIRQRGWSQRRAAREAGLSFATMHGVIAGTGVPELPTLKKIADGFNVSLARLQELAGFAPGADGTGGSDPLYGLTDEQRELLRRLSPEKKRALIDLARQMLEE